MIPPDTDRGDALLDADRGGDFRTSKTVMKGTGGKEVRASPPEVSQREAGRRVNGKSSPCCGDSQLGADSQGESAPGHYPGPHSETALTCPIVVPPPPFSVDLPPPPPFGG
ncbi:uncharacterized protein LOC143283426 [Babylonia areolata]|uniref:uncharacterized protein LOC143283426 n=1 Tax=Babylonia areolata TaxID=304850 RepID=UPI003FCEEB0F